MIIALLANLKSRKEREGVSVMLGMTSTVTLKSIEERLTSYCLAPGDAPQARQHPLRPSSHSVMAHCFSWFLVLFTRASAPSEEFEFTGNLLGANIETHGKLILRTLIYLTMNSQDDSHSELAVSFL